MEDTVTISRSDLDMLIKMNTNGVVLAFRLTGDGEIVEAWLDTLGLTFEQYGDRMNALMDVSGNFPRPTPEEAAARFALLGAEGILAAQ